jgi:hypothetical protein
LLTNRKWEKERFTNEANSLKTNCCTKILTIMRAHLKSVEKNNLD